MWHLLDVMRLFIAQRLNQLILICTKWHDCFLITDQFQLVTTFHGLYHSLCVQYCHLLTHNLISMVCFLCICGFEGYLSSFF